MAGLTALDALDPDTQFTCFTSTKVQILTPEEAQTAGLTALDALAPDRVRLELALSSFSSAFELHELNLYKLYAVSCARAN